MKHSTKFFLILITILFVIIFGLLIFFSIKDVSQDNLFTWSIFDLVELFVTALIGTIFGYFLSVSSPKQDKKNELVAAHIDLIIDDCKYIIKSIEQKKEKKLTDTEQRELILMFRMASNDFNDLSSLPTAQNENKITEIRNLIFDMKSIITDEPFVSKQIKFDDYTKAFDKYLIIKSKLTFYKNSLFF